MSVIRYPRRMQKPVALCFILGADFCAAVPGVSRYYLPSAPADQELRHEEEPDIPYAAVPS